MEDFEKLKLKAERAIGRSKDLNKTKVLKIGNKEADEEHEKEIETETIVATDRLGGLRKLHIPARQIKPELNEILLSPKDNKEIFKYWKDYIEISLWFFDTEMFEDDRGCFWFQFNGEDCNLSLDTINNWILRIYSRQQNKYFNFDEIIKDGLKYHFVREIMDFNNFVSMKTKEKYYKPASLWEKNNNLFYLNDWNISELKEYFKLWNKKQTKTIIWILIERIFKTLKRKPEKNKNGEKIKYFLNPFPFGFDYVGNILTEKEFNLLNEKANEFLERYKMTFFDYADHKKIIEAAEKRKREIGF